MSTTITANVTEMFSRREPYDCSNSEANLGPQCVRLTWQCALEVADSHATWLLTPLSDACEGMQAWARETGVWDHEEIESWSDEECLALLVQNVASELRLLGSDDDSLENCAVKYQRTDWDRESECPTGCYYLHVLDVNVDYYTGV